MKGWFAVSRGITDHHLFKGHPERLAVWMWLLDHAAWKETKHDINGQTIDIQRGSVCASSRHIADSLGVGHQVVRTAIVRFKNERMINTEVTRGKTVISLCNYEKHQDPESITNTPLNTRPTHDQHTTNTQKNKETKKQEKDTIVSSGDYDVSSAFEDFQKAARYSGWPIPSKLSSDRKRALTARLKECGGANGWREVLTKASRSAFLSQSSWFGFDWVLKPKNLRKIMEGNYDDRVGSGDQPGSPMAGQQQNGPGRGGNSIADEVARRRGQDRPKEPLSQGQAELFGGNRR